MFDVDVVICWVVLLLVPESILSRKDPPKSQGNDAANGDTPTNDPPGDVVPWPIFGLPHERTYGISDTVGNQNDGVGRDSFSVSRGDGGDPGKNEGEPRNTDVECPNRTQKSNPISPWQ